MVVLAALGAAVLTAAVIGLIWYIRLWSVGAAVGRALVLMHTAHTPAAIDDAFAVWDSETRGRWRGREAALIEHTMGKYDPTEARVRALLNCIAGADYGDRKADWDRWYAAWKRRREGKPPALKSDEAVRLNREWEAAVGLTAWHTTILPIDGQIYVASLGSDVSSADDPSDGLVRVNGYTGAAELFFVPPDRGPRDVLGVAAGSEVLFVACRNGSVYCVGLDGGLRWKTYVGGPIASIPLAADVNTDAAADVLVVTQQERVVALNGTNGRTLWAAAPPGGRRPAAARGTFVTASLATGDLLPAAGDELLLVTLDGDVRMLGLADGAQRWKGAVEAGCYGGPLVPFAENSPGRPAYVADGGGGIWSLLQASRSVDALLTWQVGARVSTALVAAPRTILTGTGAPPANGAELPSWLLATSAGSVDGHGGSVFALAGAAIRWRYTPGGVIWGTAAIADLNGDRRSEIIVPTMAGDPAGAGLTRGGITILSRDGHLLRQLDFSAPVECSPVVADVNGDGRLDVLVADRSGLLHCYSTRGFGPVEWGVYGGDSRNSRNAGRAYAWGQAPHGHQWRWRP